jgi:hypothetical protein
MRQKQAKVQCVTAEESLEGHDGGWWAVSCYSSIWEMPCLLTWHPLPATAYHEQFADLNAALQHCYWIC